MVGTGIVERVCERAWREHWAWLLVGLVDGGRAAQFGYCVHNTHALAESSDANLGLQDVGIELEEDVTSDLLLCERINDTTRASVQESRTNELVAYTLVETLGLEPFNDLIDGPFRWMVDRFLRWVGCVGATLLWRCQGRNRSSRGDCLLDTGRTAHRKRPCR